MAVDPHRVMAVPMSRHPNVINSTVPVSRAMDVIWLVVEANADRDRVGDAADAEDDCKKQCKFLHSIFSNSDLDDSSMGYLGIFAQAQISDEGATTQSSH